MNNEHQPSSTASSRDVHMTFTEARLKALKPQPPTLDWNALESMLVDRRIAIEAATSLAEQNVRRPWRALAVAWSLGVAVGILCMLFLRPPTQPSPLAEAVESETPAISRQEANSQDVEESPMLAARASAAQSVASSSSQATAGGWPANSMARELRVGTHLFTSNSSLAHSASQNVDLDPTSPSVYEPSYRSHAEALEATSLPQHRFTPRNLLKELLEGHGNHVL